MSLTLREIKLLKQRRKKSGPPCGVDFKRELTSSVLTSRGFHCTLFCRKNKLYDDKMRGVKSLLGFFFFLKRKKKQPFSQNGI